jgi:hypothetical protein
MDNFKSLKPDQDEFFEWCKANSLNNKKMKELLKVIKKCCEDVSRIENTIVAIGPFNEDNVLKIVKKLLENSYGDNRFDWIKSGVYYSKINKTYYKLDTQQALNPNSKSQHSSILALNTREIVSSGSFSNNIISLSFPI